MRVAGTLFILTMGLFLFLGLVVPPLGTLADTPAPPRSVAYFPLAGSGDSSNPPVASGGTTQPTPTATPTSTPWPSPTATNPPSPTPTNTRVPAPTVAPQASWLAYTNFYRSTAGLPPVSDNPTLSHAAWLHARYMVMTNIIAHHEDQNSPWYTPEGHAAARTSNLVASHNASHDHVYALDGWMQAPFHALGIIDPRLHQVGFGLYQEANGGIQMGSALDVIRGRGQIHPAVRYPIMWPAPGTTVPLRLHWNELPSPLASCPGYTIPSGLPVMLQLGSGNLTPHVTGSSFTHNNVALEHCVFDESTYTNPDPSQQSVVRSVLNSRDAIVLVPRQPLDRGKTYSVSITASNQTHTWSFSVSQVTADAAELAAGFELENE